MRRRSQIATYGVPVTKQNDKLVVPGGPDGTAFEIQFTLSPDLRPEDVPPGSEIRYLDDAGP
jgi:hypothetical protein